MKYEKDLDFQRARILGIISYHRKLIGEATFPADAKLFYEQEIKRLEEYMAAVGSLDDAEQQLSTLVNNIQETASLSNNPSESTFQKVRRTFNGIFRQ